jgi:predicted HicB family RNase H-like nuclease
MSRINIEIPDEVHRKLKAACALRDIVLKDYIEEALKEALRNDKDKH